MSTAGTRSRSGCKTCRTRKLKCDETKPICGQCRKSNRECIPSEGIAFRHAQNAGLDDSGSGGQDLANFYKYRQKFNNTYFLPVPRELSFIHVTDPYATESSDTQSQSMTNALHLQQMQQQEAESQRHQHQQQLQMQMDMHMPQYILDGLHEHAHAHTHPEYVDVAASSLKAMIDPNLEASTQDMEALAQLGLHHVPPNINEHRLDTDNLDETILKALRNTDEDVKSMQ